MVCHSPLCTHERAFDIFLKILEILIRPSLYISTITHQISNVHFEICLFPLLFNILVCSTDPIKLNFYQELQARPVQNLNNALQLELQILCKQISLKVKLVHGCLDLFGGLLEISKSHRLQHILQPCS